MADKGHGRSGGWFRRSEDGAKHGPARVEPSGEPEGWYPDPACRLRYWTGREWTSRIAYVPFPPESATVRGWNGTVCWTADRLMIGWDQDRRIEMPLSAWIRGSVSLVSRPGRPSVLKLTLVLNPRRITDPSTAAVEQLQVSLLFNQDQIAELDEFLLAMGGREEPDRLAPGPGISHEPLPDTASAAAPPAEPPQADAAEGDAKVPEAVGSGDGRAASQSAPPAVFIQPLTFVAAPDSDEWTSFRPLPATESLITFTTSSAADNRGVPL